ncbi:MAG TPA: signal peptidase II [Herpetosiphonaceae bacterium]|nr:signal peptidase II [Herpetosiphonaceae bacterium]
MNFRIKDVTPILVVVALVLVADRLVKWWTLDSLTPLGNPGIEALGGLLRFVYVENRGVAFGMFQNNSLLFALLSITVIIGAIWRSWGWFWRTSLLARLSAGLIVAGGLGNIIDRLLYGFVVDMIHIVPMSFFQVFNVADMAISFGAVLLFICLWREDAGHRAANARRKPDDALSASKSE